MGAHLRCASCDSDDVEARGPDAYHCSACDYWGGEGALRAAREAAGGTWDEGKARRSAYDDLVQARLMLVGLGGGDRTGVPEEYRRTQLVGAAVEFAFALPDGESAVEDPDYARYTAETTFALVRSAWRRLELPQATLDRALEPRGLIEFILAKLGWLDHARLPRVEEAVNRALAELRREFEP